MRLDSSQSQGDLLRQLEQQARATWGDARLEALRPALAATASALWELLQQPLEPLDEAP